MSRESVVEIKGNWYRYGYQDGQTRYLGPVGDGPQISEAEFLATITWEVEEGKFFTEEELDKAVVDLVSAKDRVLDGERELLVQYTKAKRMIRTDRELRKRELMMDLDRQVEEEMAKEEEDLLRAYRSDRAGLEIEEVKPVYKNIIERVQNKENWKTATKPVFVWNKSQANVVQDALTYFLGGSELEKIPGGYVVTSRGYYHYIGA